jgi:hypothetical protein
VILPYQPAVGRFDWQKKAANRDQFAYLHRGTGTLAFRWPANTAKNSGRCQTLIKILKQTL